ncbi:hypothetical protein GCM10028864_24580 [Microlunatus parietis]
MIWTPSKPWSTAKTPLPERHLRDTTVIIQHLPCKHAPEPGAHSICRCVHCDTALKRIWVVDPADAPEPMPF